MGDAVLAQARMAGCVAILFATLVALPATGVAQDSDEASQPTPLSEQETAQLEEYREVVIRDEDVLALLAERLDNTEGLVRTVTQARYDKIAKQQFETILKAAALVLALEAKDKDVALYRDLVVNELPGMPEAVFAALERVGDEISYPNESLETVELVKADQRLFAAIRSIDEFYAILIDYEKYSQSLGLQIESQRELIATQIKDAAANRSAFLDMSLTTVSGLRAAVNVLPENADLAGRLSAAEARVRLIALSLQRMSALMDAIDLDTRHYRHQVLTATGEITTDVLNVSVVGTLLRDWYLALVDMVTEEGPKFLFRILLVIVIVYVFVRISRLVQTVIDRGLDSSKVKISHLLRRMVLSTSRNVVILLGILIALSQIGISLGPLLAGLGIAGFIIGFAMQDSLSNFASGMLILLYRPFDVGDVVDAGGVSGKVSSMSLVNTTIMTFDNQTMVVPNNLIWGQVIRNVTVQKTRRIDLTFGISYSDDIEKAERVFREIVDSHEKVLDDPEPMIHLHELGDSSVNFIVRPWVNTDDYWDVYWALTREVKLRLDAEGISIPFPQRDVHLHGPAIAQA